MGEAKEIWKRLFFVLHNNKQPDDDLPTMWTPFKAGNLQDGDLETAVELLLSPQQREAIGSRHPLKFILGHYGSGKVIDCKYLDRLYLFSVWSFPIEHISFASI